MKNTKSLDNEELKTLRKTLNYVKRLDFFKNNKNTKKLSKNRQASKKAA